IQVKVAASAGSTTRRQVRSAARARKRSRILPSLFILSPTSPPLLRADGPRSSLSEVKRRGGGFHSTVWSTFRGRFPEAAALDRSEPNSITRLLLDWRRGDEQALERLLPLVYEELRAVAGRYMRGERSGHTLQATAVVHEAYVRLINMEIDWRDRAHFFAVAARSMRRILVDHARARRRDRRGGGARSCAPVEQL